MKLNTMSARLGVVAVALGKAELHVVVVVNCRVVIARHLLVTTDHQSQRRRHLIHVNTQIGGTRSIDLDT